MTTNKTGRITGTEMEEAISRFERDCRSDGVGETARSLHNPQTSACRLQVGTRSNVSCFEEGTVAINHE